MGREMSSTSLYNQSQFTQFHLHLIEILMILKQVRKKATEKYIFGE